MPTRPNVTRTTRREYGRAVHNDYSLRSAPRRVLDHVPDDADELLKHRFAEINVWRAIRGPIESSRWRYATRAASTLPMWSRATWSIASRRRDLRVHLQPEPSMVLLSADGRPRRRCCSSVMTPPTTGARASPRIPRSMTRRVRRTRGRAREYRSASAGVLRTRANKSPQLKSKVRKRSESHEFKRKWQSSCT